MEPTKRRTTPTPDELRIWREYLETSSAVSARLAERMQRESALSSADYTVLLALSEASAHTLRSSEVATRIGWERSRVSHHLGRMEKRGLIRREACNDDSRGSDVILTDTGSDAFRRGSVPHLRDIHELFVRALTPAQLAAAADIAGALRVHLASIDHA